MIPYFPDNCSVIRYVDGGCEGTGSLNYSDNKPNPPFPLLCGQSLNDQLQVQLLYLKGFLGLFPNKHVSKSEVPDKYF